MARIKGITAKNASQTKKDPFDDSIFLDRLDGIFRTAWYEHADASSSEADPARQPGIRRKDLLIEAQTENGCFLP